MNRRTMLKGIAWATPTVTVVTAAPALATSQLGPSRIRFTNTTARVGKSSNSIYTNTRVQVIDGPAPVENVVLTIHLDGYETALHTWSSIAGWSSPGQVYDEWGGLQKRDHVVTFTAVAEGMEPITASVAVKAPEWWT